MEKVSFKLVTAFQIIDSLNSQVIRDYRIECDPRIKRVNKENGIVVLTYVPDQSSPISKTISIVRDRYQTCILEASDDLGNTALKIPMVPNKDIPIPEGCSTVYGNCSANETVVLDFLTKKGTINEEIPSIRVKANDTGEFYIAFQVIEKKAKLKLSFITSGNTSEFTLEPGENKEIKPGKKKEG